MVRLAVQATPLQVGVSTGKVWAYQAHVTQSQLGIRPDGGIFQGVEDAEEGVISEGPAGVGAGGNAGLGALEVRMAEVHAGIHHCRDHPCPGVTLGVGRQDVLDITDLDDGSVQCRLGGSLMGGLA